MSLGPFYSIEKDSYTEQALFEFFRFLGDQIQSDKKYLHILRMAQIWQFFFDFQQLIIFNLVPFPLPRVLYEFNRFFAGFCWVPMIPYQFNSTRPKILKSPLGYDNDGVSFGESFPLKQLN